MDAVTVLRDYIDIEQLMEHYEFNHIHRDGDMIRACCKLHDGNNPTAFVANNENGLWYCHTDDCGGGDAFTLVQRIENVSFTEAVQIIARHFNVDIENLEIKERTESYVKELQKWTRAMKTRIKKKEMTSFDLGVALKDVTKFRQFKEETMTHFGLKYARRVNLHKKDGTEYVLQDRLVVPIIVNNVQIGASLRKIRAHDYPKWSHQPENIDAGDILYNYDAVRGLTSIVICEGIFDVWAFHEIGVTAVCTFGAHVTDEQYRMLMRTGCDLIFAFDGDDAGQHATRKATIGYTDKHGKFHEGQFKNKANCFIVPFEGNEDPESITREQLKIKYERRKRLC